MKIVGKVGQNRLQYHGPARGCADGNHLDFDQARLKVILARGRNGGHNPGVGNPRPSSDDLDLRHRLYGAEQLCGGFLLVRMAGAGGLLDNGQSPRLKGAKCLRDFLRLVTRADHHNRCGMGFHNSPRGIQAIHFRHVDVHRDDVRLQALYRSQRLFSVARPFPLLESPGRNSGYELLTHLPPENPQRPGLLSWFAPKDTVVLPPCFSGLPSRANPSGDRRD